MELEVTINMNSSVEAILAFKCCNVTDQNLEVIIRNRDVHPVRISHRFELLAGDGSRKTVYLYPPGTRLIAPGDVAAYYGAMDEVEWQRYREMVLFDERGASCRVALGLSKSGERVKRREG